jgi:uncharacterized protein
MELGDPLTDEELDELGEFLLSPATPEDAMDIAMLDGFLTALAIGPHTLPPSAWMPLVWGGEMAWQSREQADRMIGLVFRHANSIVFHLRDEPDTFEPLLYEREHEGALVPVLDEWCTGFVEGMALDEEGWLPLVESAEGDELLYPILLFGSEDGAAALRDDPTLEDRSEEFAELLGERIMAIRERWLPTRKQKSTLRREEPKVGRNEPCPCGSGKKFKKCCGSGDKVLH